jgi:hypothetical protein
MGWKNMKTLLPGALAALGLLAAAPAWGANTTARPGTINYVEGRVLLNGRALTAHSIGNAELDAGQVLDTEQGKAEVLLTPGVFLRVGDNSEVRMVNPGLTNTSVAVTHGEALLEVTMLMKENHLQVADAGTETTVVKDGLYRFVADNNPSVSVIKGEAEVLKGDRNVKVKNDHELLLAQATNKPQKFDKASEDDLYAWSKLRSDYMAQANAANVQLVLAGGYPWYGPGWYWSPWYDMYAFMPGWGFWSPFGYPYMGVGFYGGYYGPAFYRGAVIGHRIAPGTGLRAGTGFRSGPHMAVRGPALGVNNGFSRMGGGFGGFHGGGFGGRR